MSGSGNVRYIGYELLVATKPHVSTRKEDHGALFRRILIKVGTPLDKRLVVIGAFNGLGDPNFNALAKEVASAMND